MNATSCPVGIVIATRNRAEGLCGTLERLRGLPERPAVVVVDNASTDHSPDLVVERFPEVRVIKLPHNLGAAARNAGVEALSSPFVAFCDDDSWWAPGSLKAAAKIFEAHPGISLLAGKVLVGEDQWVDPTCDLMADSPLGRPPGMPGPLILGFIACGAVVRREAFLQAGGFDARFGIGGEEEHLALGMAALGWDLAYAEDLIAHHHPSPIRDKGARLATITRNRLWTAWLLRAGTEVARTTLASLAQAATNAGVRRGVIQALRGLPWVLRERRRVPARVEAMARTVGEARA